MREFIRRSGAALSVLLSGVAVEFILAIAKNEPVSWQRFGTLLAIIVVLSIVLQLAESKRASWRRVVAGGLITIGVLAVAIGVVILFRTDLTDNTLANVIGTATVSSGVIVILSGFYVAMQRGVVQRDDPDEYKNLTGKSIPITKSPNSATLTTFDGDISDAVVDLCKAQMNLADLHFIGLYVHGKCRFYIDVLNDNSSRMENMRGDIPAETRRQRYEAYGRLTHGFVSRLDSTFEEVEQGELIRVVLDVAQGAFYYTKIDKRRFLFGVTLNQDAVNLTDTKVRELAIAIEDLSGLRPDGPLRPALQEAGSATSGDTAAVVPMQRPRHA